MATVLCSVGMPAASGDELRPYTVVGDAIPASLTGTVGDPERGRAIVGNRPAVIDKQRHRGVAAGL